MSRTLLITFMLIIFSISQACAKTDSDPFEGYNRAAFAFNDGFDNLIAKPIAQFYLDVTPTPVVDGVSNVYDNLNTLPTIGNDLLQANFHQAVNDSCRFVLNSTLGILGIFDVATLVGIPSHSEDAGLTLAYYGWKNSSYFIIPFIGPSTVRDSIGYVTDYFMSVYPYVKNSSVQTKLMLMGIVDVRANLLQLQNVISQAALDPYVFQRNAFLQRRAYLIKQNDLNNQEKGDAHLVDDQNNNAVLAGAEGSGIIQI